MNQASPPATPFGEAQKHTDPRRDRIGDAINLLEEERKIAADERAQAGYAQYLRDKWYGKYNATLNELYTTNNRLAALEKQWHEQRQSDGVTISVLQREVEDWKNESINRDLDNADLRRENDRLRAPLMHSTTQECKVRSIAGIPMNFILDVNMPPDTVVIRNSNGHEVEFTGLGPG